MATDLAKILTERGFRKTEVEGRWKTPEHWRIQDEGELRVYDNGGAEIVSDDGVILFAMAGAIEEWG